MALTIDPKKYFIGAAMPWFRAIGGSGPWTSVGAVADNVVATITSTWFSPTNLQGVRGKIKGLDILRGVDAQGQFSLPEISAANMGIALPGAVSATAPTADAGGSPGSTTLGAAANMGDTVIQVAATTNFAVNDWFRIETGAGVVEYRQVDQVLATPARLAFRDPLQRAHANGSAVVETTGDGRTTITAPTVRRQPDSAYNDWALVAESGNGYAELRLLNAISETQSMQLTTGDGTLAAMQVTIGSRYDGASLATSPFQLIVP